MLLWILEMMVETRLQESAKVVSNCNSQPFHWRSISSEHHGRGVRERQVKNGDQDEELQCTGQFKPSRCVSQSI